MTKRYTWLGKDKRAISDLKTVIAAALADADSSVNDAVEALVSAGGGGGGGDTYPMNAGIWYDNGTAMAGTEGDDPAALGADTILGALITVTDPDATTTGVGFIIYGNQTGDATARFALYAVSETGTSRGLPGAKVADLGTVLVPDGSLIGESFSITPDAAVEPGDYWLCASATADIALASFRTYGGTLGRADFTDGAAVSSAGVSVTSTGAHTAMPATLEGVVQPSDLTQEAPRFFFQVTPN